MGTLTLFWVLIGAVTFLVLLRLPAPYGRHRTKGWGPTIPHRLGWVVMESTSLVALLVSYHTSGGNTFTYATILVGLWYVHYLHRALIQPFRARWSGRRMPVLIMLSAIVFNSINGGLNGWYLGHMSWVPSIPQVVGGGILFVAGFGLNIWSDEVLRRLRTPGSSAYRIPQGGVYRWISCPNYAGEIVEWVGFALMAATPAAWAFAFWTAANLIPRALSHHAWYRDTFPTYPDQRKAVVPFIL